MNINKLLNLSVIFILLLTVSCEKNEFISPKANKERNVYVKENRLVFKNSEQMLKTYSLFNNQSEIENQNWQSKYPYKPLINRVASIKSANEGVLDSANFCKYGYIPTTLMPFINEGCEMQIGDTIVWINQNMEYRIVNGDEKLLQLVKTKIHNGVKIDLDDVEVTEIQKYAHPSLYPKYEGNQLKSLSGNWNDARYQYQFTPKNEKEHKIVHEATVYHWQSMLIVEVHIKFEYWKKRWPRWRSDWAPAGQDVTKQINNVQVYVKDGSNIGAGTLNAGPVTDGSNLVKGVMFPFYSIDYLKISGEMKATVPQFSTTYNVNGTLWERNF